MPLAHGIYVVSCSEPSCCLFVCACPKSQVRVRLDGMPNVVLARGVSAVGASANLNECTHHVRGTWWSAQQVHAAIMLARQTFEHT
eukprot:1053115-Pleurochrysis_carterae.AAC.1